MLSMALKLRQEKSCRGLLWKKPDPATHPQVSRVQLPGSGAARIYILPLWGTLAQQRITQQ